MSGKIYFLIWSLDIKTYKFIVKLTLLKKANFRFVIELDTTITCTEISRL